MPTFDPREGLPAGYFVEESPDGVLAVHGDFAIPLLRFGYGPSSDGPLTPSTATGRQPLLEIALPEETLLVRRFRHGGLLRWSTGGRYLDPSRPFRELALSFALRRIGIPTPEVVAARARKAPLWGWELDLVVRRVPDATDLGMWLARVRRGEVDRRKLRPVLREAGRTVRALHLAGCLHADLNPNNLLVELRPDGTPRVWVLDLDGSRLLPRLEERSRRENLRRLYRHIVRREARLGRVLSTTDYARFLIAWDGGRGEWKDAWKEIHARHGRSLVWHRIGWFLEGRLSRRADPREWTGAVPRADG